MNDRQKVVLISALVTLALITAYASLGYFLPRLNNDNETIAIALPIIIGIAVIIPIWLRRAR